MVTEAKNWKKAESTHELTVPSGNVCLVRRPGPSVFLEDGNIPNSLLTLVMPLLEEAQDKGKTGDSTPMPDSSFADLQKIILDDPTKLKDLFTMMDHITVACVVSPVVLPEPEIGGERDPEALYVDEIDFEDKSFIFNFIVGGTADLERFREGTDSAVAARQAGD